MKIVHVESCRIVTIIERLITVDHGRSRKSCTRLARMAKAVLLDGNIYNELATDAVGRAMLTKAVQDGFVRVIVTPVLVDELAGSPFGGIPDWFPVEHEAENVFVYGRARWGMARYGEGTVYKKHRGTSNQVPDAIIADSANALAQVLVTNDRRCRKRLSEISTTCLAMDYDEFKQWLRGL